jgi:hypothetical protein
MIFLNLFKKFFKKKEEKNSASIEEMAEAIVQIACNVPVRQMDIDFINDIAGKSIDESVINKAINEIIIFRAAISSLLFLRHYKNHSKFIIIKDELRNRLNELFNNIPELWERRFCQYADALGDENPIETVSTVLQYILEQTTAGIDFTKLEHLEAFMSLKDIAKEWAYPLWSHEIKCAIFVGEFIVFFTAWNNRWEIK